MSAPVAEGRTLAPSIGIGRQEGGGYHWHGYLENGEFVER